VYRNLGRVSEARKAFAHALEIDPTLTNIQEALEELDVQSK
jgi:cytochrome c-type biogenesis protein CcmH/NrfG